MSAKANREYIYVPLIIKQGFKYFTVEQKATLLSLMLEYGDTQKEPDEKTDPIVMASFEMFRRKEDANRQAWEEKCRNISEGKISGKHKPRKARSEESEDFNPSGAAGSLPWG